MDVGFRWLLQLMVARFQVAPAPLYVKPAEGAPTIILQRLEAELDELWSLVRTKEKRQGGGLPCEATTRQVIAFHVGDRSGQSATALGEKIPAVDQEHAVFYTNHYAAYTRSLLLLPNTVRSPRWAT
jgi:hypothetical protein